MNIAFCGSSGTGKTTLARHLAEVLGLDFNPVGSRSTARAFGFENPYDVDRASVTIYEESLKEGLTPSEAAAAAVRDVMEVHGAYSFTTMRGVFQRKLQAAKIEWELNHQKDGFVSDRTTVDDFAYLCLHQVDAVDEEFIERARDHLAVYDIIFFTPLAVFHNHGDDPSRVDDIAYHRVHEMLLQGALRQFLGDDGWRRRVRVVGVSDLRFRQAYVLAEAQGKVRGRFPRGHTDVAIRAAVDDLWTAVGDARAVYEDTPRPLSIERELEQAGVRLDEAQFWTNQAQQILAQKARKG